jgi:hypothetical protein
MHVMVISSPSSIVLDATVVCTRESSSWKYMALLIVSEIIGKNPSKHTLVYSHDSSSVSFVSTFSCTTCKVYSLQSEDAPKNEVSHQAHPQKSWC